MTLGKFIGCAHVNDLRLLINHLRGLSRANVFGIAFEQ
jgi:bisphosphoglycerate-dependent phosphoglycerate mutase